MRTAKKQAVRCLVELSRVYVFGSSWSVVSLEVPKELADSEIDSVPPFFFSESDGILMTNPIVENQSQLFYITEEQIRGFIQHDPAIQAGLMNTECYPMQAIVPQK